VTAPVLRHDDAALDGGLSMGTVAPLSLVPIWAPERSGIDPAFADILSRRTCHLGPWKVHSRMPGIPSTW
jgi:hypothetical protein